MYGDSLTLISERPLDYLYASKYTIVVRAEGGSAMCDFSGEAAADRILYHPSRVVIAFTGNDHTCVANDYKKLWNRRVFGELRTLAHAVPCGLCRTADFCGRVTGHASLWPADWFPENGDPALNDLYQTLCAQRG